MLAAGAEGAVLGLICGMGEYVVVMRMLARAMMRQSEVYDGAHQLLARRMQMIKWALLASAFVILPAAGFAVGQAYGN
jgi:hypothetical protein